MRRRKSSAYRVADGASPTRRTFAKLCVEVGVARRSERFAAAGPWPFRPTRAFPRRLDASRTIRRRAILRISAAQATRSVICASSFPTRRAQRNSMFRRTVRSDKPESSETPGPRPCAAGLARDVFASHSDRARLRISNPAIVRNSVVFPARSTHDKEVIVHDIEGYAANASVLPSCLVRSRT